MSEPQSSIRLAAVIVLFNPADSIIPFVTSLRDAGHHVVMVINAISPTLLDSLRVAQPGSIIVNETNLGLAHAFNQGIRAAIDLDMTHIFLLDQDSRPDPAVPLALARLMAAHGDKGGAPIACIGPRIIDRKRPDARCQVPANAAGDLIDVDTIISSGSVISVAAIKAVGLMWSELFIDMIDHEWCHRATSRGYRVCVAPNIVMEHDMGDAGVSVLGRFRPVQRKPVRHYHIVRNTLWLASQAYIPAHWRATEVLKLAYRIPFYMMVSDDRGQSARSISKALVAGFGAKRATQ